MRIEGIDYQNKIVYWARNNNFFDLEFVRVGFGIISDINVLKTEEEIKKWGWKIPESINIYGPYRSKFVQDWWIESLIFLTLWMILPFSI